jgi:hypothetical protein
MQNEKYGILVASSSITGENETTDSKFEMGTQ